MHAACWTLIAFGAGAAASETAPHAERALAVEREVERLAAQRVLWPGYDPLAIPLAVFTGERTYLFRHPAPPPGLNARARVGERDVVVELDPAPAPPAAP